jgi:hypothetical protein
MNAWSGAALAGALFLAGCGYDDPGFDPTARSGELDSFAEYVQPVLQVSCASLDCHGNAGRPLRLYAKNGLRLIKELRGEDASDTEMQANIEAIDGLDPASIQVEDRLFLLKPLSVDAGGLHHIGGDLWIDQNDGTYRCLHAWLRAGVSDDAGKAICNQVRP